MVRCSEQQNSVLIFDEIDVESLMCAFAHNGLRTFRATNGIDGLKLLYTLRPDVVLLDLGIDHNRGWSILERIRDLTETPVVAVTDADHRHDVVQALDRGADDVVIRPFSIDELCARISVWCRRIEAATNRVHHGYVDDNIDVNYLTRTVITKGKERALTRIEFQLLETLVRNVNVVLSYNQMFELVWNDPYGGNDGTIQTAILRLRHKLGWNNVRRCPIETVRGVGYRYRSK